MTTPRYPGPFSFLPEATGQIISYSRDPKEFAVNDYVQSIKAPAMLGTYYRLDRDHPARIVADADYAWEDGDDRPMGKHNLGNFELVPFRCQRRAISFTLGDMTVENAKDWKPFAVQASIIAQQMMTLRTKRIVTLLEASSNWGSNYATADALNEGAGHWDRASDSEAEPGFLAIKKALDEACRRIHLATNAKVKKGSLVLVISPGLAIKMANTAEIHSYLRQSPYALAQVKGDKAGQNAVYGLPDMLYGIKVVIEDATVVGERANSAGTAATTNRTYLKSDDSAVLCSRPGGIDGQYGAPSYSTVQCYFWKWEMAVESHDDRFNLRKVGTVIEAYSEQLAAPPTGFLIQDCLS